MTSPSRLRSSRFRWTELTVRAVRTSTGAVNGQDLWGVRIRLGLCVTLEPSSVPSPPFGPSSRAARTVPFVAHRDPFRRPAPHVFRICHLWDAADVDKVSGAKGPAVRVPIRRGRVRAAPSPWCSAGAHYRVFAGGRSQPRSTFRTNALGQRAGRTRAANVPDERPGQRIRRTRSAAIGGSPHRWNPHMTSGVPNLALTSAMGCCTPRGGRGSHAWSVARLPGLSDTTGPACAPCPTPVPVPVPATMAPPSGQAPGLELQARYSTWTLRPPVPDVLVAILGHT